MSLLRQQGPALAPPSPAPSGTAGARTTGGGSGRRSPGMSARTRHRGMGLLLITPFTLLFLAFLVAPLAYAFWLSLRTSTLVGGDHFSWFANYKQTFTDPHFLSGVRRVAVFGLAEIPLMLGLGAYGIAATIDFAHDAKQSLLESRSEGERLGMLSELIDAAMKRVDYVERAGERAKSNGKIRFQ